MFILYFKINMKNLQYLNLSKNYLTEELEKLGAKVYKSYANFLLVDFGERCEFIYNKLKKYSIITRIFSNDLLKNHLRIAIPPLNQAKKLIEILNNNKTLVFDMDGVLIDVRKSFRQAIKSTYNFLFLTVFYLFIL